MYFKFVKGIFYFFLAYLPLQYMLIGVAGLKGSEPWPAFALPGFKKVYTTQNQSEITSPRFYAWLEGGEGELEIPASELFQGIQLSQLQGFIRENFSDSQQYSDEARAWLKDRVDKVYPDKSITELRVVWEKTIYKYVDNRLSTESTEAQRVVSISFTE